MTAPSRSAMGTPLDSTGTERPSSARILRLTPESSAPAKTSAIALAAVPWSSGWTSSTSGVPMSASASQPSTVCQEGEA